MSYWWIAGITAVVLAVVYFFLYRRMKRQKADFDKMYTSHKEVKEIFVMNKKIDKQPVRPGLKFPKVKTYQIVARITVSQKQKGTSFSATQTHTFMTEKKQFEKIDVNRKYRVELAGNYIGRVISGKK